VTGPRELAVARAAELAPKASEEEWLIESIWGRNAVGIVGGCPKTWKSWYGLEMAVSVASATPCLGRFPVRAPGPALVFLAEDALPSVRDRIEGLCRSRERRIESLDLFVITEPVLRLDDEDCRQRLTRTVEKYRPRLLLLDPLIRLHRLSENDSQEISGLLGHLRELQRRHEVSVVLVHHAGKRRRASPGQSLRGSSDLHAWTDTTAILTRREDRVVLTLEHRFAAAPGPLTLGLSVEDDHKAGLVLLGEESAGDENGPLDLTTAVLGELRKAQGPLRRGDLRQRVRANNERLGLALTSLESDGRIRRGPTGWGLVNGNGNRCGEGDLFATGTG
jgi:hypothetical protein